MVVEQSTLNDLVAVAGGCDHSVALKSDGRIVAWGNNQYGQCDVPTPNADFVAIAAGMDYSLGLNSDGRIVAWGRILGDEFPAPNTDFVAIAAGKDHGLGLKSDGRIVAWGNNQYGQCDVPMPNADFAAIAAGIYHSLGLKSNGTIVAWGNNPEQLARMEESDYGQCNVPMPNATFTAVTAGGLHSLGLKDDGSIVAFGNNYAGECDVPEPNSGFVAVAAGASHSLGLRSDGRVVAWGANHYGQCDVPEKDHALGAIAAGFWHSLGIDSSGGAVVAWGSRSATAWQGTPRPDAIEIDIPGPPVTTLAFGTSVYARGYLAVPAGYYQSSKAWQIRLCNTKSCDKTLTVILSQGDTANTMSINLEVVRRKTLWDDFVYTANVPRIRDKLGVALAWTKRGESEVFVSEKMVLITGTWHRDGIVSETITTE